MVNEKMSSKTHDLLFDKIDIIGKDITTIKVQLAGFTEQFKSLSKTQERHDKDISDLYSRTEKNMVSTAKLAGGGGIVGAVIMFIATKIFGG